MPDDIELEDDGKSSVQLQQQQRRLPPPMDGSNLSLEMRMAKLEWELDALRREIVDQKETIDGLVAEKERAMKWGLMLLVSAVLGMGTWIFNFVLSHVTTK